MNDRERSVITMMAAVRRRADMTHDECLHYAEHMHGAIARKNPLALVRYVQDHAFDGGYGATGATAGERSAPRDFVTELTFADMPGLGRTFGDPYTREVVAPDGANFSDLDDQIAQLTAPFEIAVPAPGTGKVKLMHFLAKAHGLSLQDFFERWTAGHAAAMTAAPEAAGAMRGYTQHRYLPEGDQVTAHFGPAVGHREGVAAMWFDDAAGALQSFRAYQAALHDVEPPFLDPARSFFLLTTEVIIIDEQ